MTSKEKLELINPLIQESVSLVDREEVEEVVTTLTINKSGKTSVNTSLKEKK